MSYKKAVWYPDYYRTLGGEKFTYKRFIKDFIFQHRIRYVFYLRHAQHAKNRLSRLYYKYMLYRMSRKYGIEMKAETKIGPGLVMFHPYNITISPDAVIGRNMNISKGATIGISLGSHEGAPTIGDSVYVGINATVVGGITIGDDVLIAPGALVTRDVPSHSLAMGNPCKVYPRENAAARYVLSKYMED